MRWNIGDYQVKINPSTYSRNNDSQVEPVFTASGVNSTANTTYETSQSFSINIVEKKTSTSISLSGLAKYKAMSMNPANSRYYLLRDSDSKIDVMALNNKTVLRNLTITASAGGVIGAGTATSIANNGTNIFMLYIQKTGNDIISNEIAVLDDNAKTIRKYKYEVASNMDGRGKIESITSYNNEWIYGLSKSGAIFKINSTNGQISFLFSTYDNAENVAKGKTPYRSIAIFVKAGIKYIALLNQIGEISFFTEGGMAVACAKTNMGIFKEITNDILGDMKLLTDNAIYEVRPNTSSLDVEIIRKNLRKGEITVTDENAMMLRMSVKGFSVERIKNFDEGRYIVEIEGKVIDVPQGFNR